MIERLCFRSTGGRKNGDLNRGLNVEGGRLFALSEIQRLLEICRIVRKCMLCRFQVVSYKKRKITGMCLGFFYATFLSILQHGVYYGTDDRYTRK